jgi:hypothetical protein
VARELSGDELRRQSELIQDIIEFRSYRESQRRYVAWGGGYETLPGLTRALVERVKASGWGLHALIIAIELDELKRGSPHRYEEPELGRYLTCIRDLTDAFGSSNSGRIGG